MQAQFLYRQYFRLSSPKRCKLIAPNIIIPTWMIVGGNFNQNIYVAGVIAPLAEIIAQDRAKDGQLQQVMAFNKIKQRRFDRRIVKPQPRAQTLVNWH